jgi:hypothetical protein
VTVSHQELDEPAEVTPQQQVSHTDHVSSLWLLVSHPIAPKLWWVVGRVVNSHQ